ncbi:hypothetical protein HOY82DRAFT_593456 [Tuber indicum]|nr:hypothetical protein HOY82DRAFT_593456 [Tuber indicum]
MTTLSAHAPQMCTKKVIAKEISIETQTMFNLPTPVPQPPPEPSPPVIQGTYNLPKAPAHTAAAATRSAADSPHGLSTSLALGFTSAVIAPIFPLSPPPTPPGKLPNPSPSPSFNQHPTNRNPPTGPNPTVSRQYCTGKPYRPIPSSEPISYDTSANRLASNPCASPTAASTIMHAHAGRFQGHLQHLQAPA